MTDDDRKQKGLEIAALYRIVERNGVWTVPSSTGNGSYRVSLKPPSPFVPLCTCEDFEKRNQKCKHVYAVEFFVQRESKPEIANGDTQPDQSPVEAVLKPKRKTYRQEWPAYNKAQTTEKSRFQILLHDLCRVLPDPPRKPGPGRKATSRADLVFAAAFKVYSTFSGRRFQTDLDEAHAKGYLSRKIRYNTVFDHFDDPDFTPILRALITESALPLKSIELDFAVDASGFSTSRFIRWFDHKYGKPMAQYDWLKCSVMTGVRSNVVTAVEIDERYSGDCPKFAPLVNATAKNFTIREVSGDKAYSSYDNSELVNGIGGTPYILYKSNATAASGGVYAKMFHLYNLNRDEFLSHYHKRSNVESTFSMIKAKFGDALRSKTDTAMANEALCKILCHNICCLIQSHYELGIEARFWGEEPEPVAEKPRACEEFPIEAWDWI